jgi:hypothetical protein
MVEEIKPEIKAKLPEGIWQKEYDYKHWVDEATGLDCMVIRHPSGGHLCGYVGVPKGHKLFGKKYSDCTLPNAKAKSKEEYQKELEEMVTFNMIQLDYTEEKAKESAEWLLKISRDKLYCSEGTWCSHAPESMFSAHGGLTYSAECNDHVCHKTDDGDHVWWFGFDCAHSDDMSPAWNNLGGFARKGMYRTAEYVEQECISLAKQIKQYEVDNL